MISTRNDDIPQVEKRKIHQTGQSSDKEPIENGGTPTKALGRWTKHGFEFASPQAKDQWHREAYRQAVHHENWHMGDPVDRETLQIIEAGAAGKSPPTFIGPDGQHRFTNFRTIEPVEVRAIRAQNFAGKGLEEVSAAEMPGEAEAALYMGGRKGRRRSAARPPLNEHAADSTMTRPSNQANPILVADSSPVPLMPDGLGPVMPVAPKPMGGVRPWNAGGKIPAGGPSDFSPRPANDNIKLNPESGGKPVPEPRSTLKQTAPAESAPTSISPTQSPLIVRKNDIDRAVKNSIGAVHQRWARETMSDPRSSDPTFIADRATQLMIFDLPYTIESFRTRPGRDIYQSATPLDIELLRGAYNQQIVDLFPKASRPAIQLALDARPKILTSGPAGLGDILQAMHQGEVTGFEVDGAPIAPETTMFNPFGTLGSPSLKDFNAIVKEEAENLLEACKDPGTEIEHVAGTGKGEFRIQDYGKPWMQEGSRRIDLTLKFKINGQDCSFQINTADTAVRRLFAKREWNAIKDSADMMRKNGVDSKVIDDYWKGCLPRNSRRNSTRSSWCRSREKISVPTKKCANLRERRSVYCLAAR